MKKFELLVAGQAEIDRKKAVIKEVTTKLMTSYFTEEEQNWEYKSEDFEWRIVFNWEGSKCWTLAGHYKSKSIFFISDDHRESDLQLRHVQVVYDHLELLAEGMLSEPSVARRLQPIMDAAS